MELEKYKKKKLLLNKMNDSNSKLFLEMFFKSLNFVLIAFSFDIRLGLKDRIG